MQQPQGQSLAPVWLTFLCRTDACMPQLSQAPSGSRFKRGMDRAVAWYLWEPNPMSCCCQCPLTLCLKTWRRGANLHLINISIPRSGNLRVFIVHKTHMWSFIGVEKAPDSDNLLFNAHRVTSCCMLAD